jgi:hypothetical protein
MVGMMTVESCSVLRRNSFYKEVEGMTNNNQLINIRWP